MTTTTTPVDNGVDVEFLRGAREALTAEPAGAKFQWRVSNTWVHGTHSQTTAQGFFGLGEEQDPSRDFRFEADHPELFSAENNGATPVEILLAVAGELPHRRHRRRGAEPRDPAPLRALPPSRATWTCGASSASTPTCATASATSRSPTRSTPTPPPADIEALVAQSQKRSAVYDILTNPTNVSVEVA